MATLRQKKYAYLIKNGMMRFEALDLSRQYSMRQLRSLPYLINMVRSRRLNRDKLRKQGYTDRQIQQSVLKQYLRRDLKTAEGDFDVWKLLKRYRKQAIEEGDYIPPKRGGSHHKDGISKGDVIGQRKRVRAREIEAYKTRLFIINKQLSDRKLRLTVSQYENLIAEKGRIERMIK